MDSISFRQLQALFTLKMKLMMRFWRQRDEMYRWTMIASLIFSTLLACLMGGAIGWLLYALTDLKQLISPDMFQLVYVGLFSGLSLIWLLSPLLFILKNESLTLDISKLTRYPISYQRLHHFHTLLALFDPWTLFFYPGLMAILIAVIARSGIASMTPMAVLVLLWILLHTTWSRLLQDVMSLLFRNRHLREILSLSVILLVIVLSFFPAILTESTSLERISRINSPSLELFLFQWPAFLKLQPILSALVYFTPAGWFAHALSGLQNEQWQWWFEGCFSLFSGTLLANVLSIRLLRHLFAEPLVIQKAGPQIAFKNHRYWHIPGMPYALRVMVLKELRTYFRSILGKLSFVLTPLLLVILNMLGVGALKSGAPSSLLLGMTVYVFMTSLFLYINYFGSDGEGFKLYLLAEVSPRQLILGKNIALGLFAAAEFAIVLVLYIVLYHQYQWDILLFGVSAFVALLMGSLTMGNLLSIRFASALDLNQTQYRQSNGTPILIALQVLSTLAGMIGWILWQATQSHQPLWLVGFVLAALMSLAWWLMLPFSIELWRQQRWNILEKVTEHE